MDGKVQDDIDKVEVNEKVDIVFSTIRPFDGVGINIDSNNLDADINIYFTRQTADDIDQAIKRLRIGVSVDDELTSD